MEKKKLTLKEIGIKRLVIILLCGIILIILSVSDGKNNEASSETKKGIEGVFLDDNVNDGTDGNNEDAYNMSKQMEDYVKSMEERIEERLLLVEGVGDVKVMITLKTSVEKVVLKDEISSNEIVDEKDSGGGNRNNESSSVSEESVLVGENSGNYPYIVKENEPIIQGVLVVAKGGDDARVKQEIIDAIWVLFDVEIHRIKVMKMVSD